MVSIARYMLKLMKRDDIINYLNSGGIFSQLTLWVVALCYLNDRKQTLH
jgi:hypothetical protein